MPAPEPPGPGPQGAALVTDRRLRAACRLALEVVRSGLLADPRIPAPHGLQKVLGFQRLSSTAFETVARAVDDDPELRTRVADAADEESVGRAAWLWLRRPEGWATDPAWLADEHVVEVGSADPTAEDGGRRSRSKAKARAETELARHRREADEARSGQRVARKELGQARRDSDAARSEVAGLHARLTTLTEERNQAVRTAKRAEAERAEARRQLKLAKEAAIDAEAELATLRAAGTLPEPVAAPRRGAATPVTGPPIDAAAASAAVSAAAGAAAELGAALARAASALEPQADASIDRSPTNTDAERVGRGRAGQRTARRSVHRAVAPLPPGIFDGTPEANRHLVSAGTALVVVDGYNLARTSWPDLSPREDRKRVVTLLEGVQARSGGDVIVVFDGESGTVAPRHSRAIRVLFSATGVTADDHIAELVASLPPQVPVVVVSSDRAVMADAGRHGATAMTSPAFLAAAGR